MTLSITDGECVLDETGAIAFECHDKATALEVVRRVNLHDALRASLNRLQANPNDPRAHRQALDTLNKSAN